MTDEIIALNDAQRQYVPALGEYFDCDRIFFTADWHLGDERMGLLHRPFGNATECAEKICENHRRVLDDNSVLFFLGDAALEPRWLEMIDDLPGAKILVKGNYDRLDDKCYEVIFQRVLSENTWLDRDRNPHADKVKSWPGKLNCVHYPTKSVAHAFNLVGHIHGAWKVQKNMLNVGVDVHHYRPVSLQDVDFYFNGICHFYDDDVWVSQLSANGAHNHRGQPSTYWERNYGGSSGEQQAKA